MLFVGLFYVQACTITHGSNGFCVTVYFWRENPTSELVEATCSVGVEIVYSSPGLPSFQLSWSFSAWQLTGICSKYGSRPTAKNIAYRQHCSGPKCSNISVSTTSVNGFQKVYSSDCTTSLSPPLPSVVVSFTG